MNHCISVNSYFRLWYVSYGGVTDENPNFACFDLLDGDDDTLRLNTLIIRVYAKPHTSTNYTLLIEHDIALCCLQFIGKDVVPSSRSINSRLDIFIIHFLWIRLWFNLQMDIILHLTMSLPMHILCLPSQIQDQEYSFQKSSWCSYKRHVRIQQCWN